MSEWKREMEVLKRLYHDPEMHANVVAVGIALGLCVACGLFLLIFF